MRRSFRDCAVHLPQMPYERTADAPPLIPIVRQSRQTITDELRNQPAPERVTLTVISRENGEARRDMKRKSDKLAGAA